MSYPMSWRRLVTRNGLGGDYSGLPNDMIAGDMRRLESNSRDSLHLALYAGIAGIEPLQAKALLDAFFGERDIEMSLTEEDRQTFATSTLLRAERAETNLTRITGALQSISYQVEYADHDLSLNLKRLNQKDELK